MSQNFFRSHWKLLLNIVTIIAFAVFIIVSRHQLVETLHNLHKVRWWVFLLVVLTQAWNYDAQVRLYRDLFLIVGNKFKYKQLLVAAIELNFINNIFPSGGVLGISYFGARMRSDNVTAGKATLVQIMKLMLLYISFEVLLVVGLFFLAAFGQVNGLVLTASAIIFTSIVFGTALLAYVLSSKARVEQFHTLLKGLYNNVLLSLGGKKGRQTHELSRVYFWLEELHNNFKIIRGEYSALKMPLVYALFANLSEILCLYVVFVAFGHWVNFGSVIIAYSVANFAGLISVLPGGVGVYEALMTTVLLANGIPLAVSLPAIIMYRVLSSLVQLPLGYYFYHRALHQDHKLESQNV
jgi:uncharacterized protein (TIRG00374 family)